MRVVISIIISILILVSCNSLKDVKTMNVFYPHNDEYCFQLTIPRTDQFGWFEVNGDRCYVFHYPSKDRLDTSRIFISHFGFEECDCSTHYTADKIAFWYNDSVVFEHFIGSTVFKHTFIVKSSNSLDTLILNSTKQEYDTSKYSLIEYLGYISSVQFLSDTEYQHLENAKRYVVRDMSNQKKMVYLDGTTVKDTLCLDGYDEKKLYWKDVRINNENINVGCVNVLPKDKEIYNKSLSTLRKIRISSIDTNKKNLNILNLLPR